MSMLRSTMIKTGRLVEGAAAEEVGRWLDEEKRLSFELRT